MKKHEETIALKDLLLSWGFYKWGTKTTGETVLVKNISKYNSSESVKWNYPLTPKLNNIYFLPVTWEYHTDLFPDLVLATKKPNIYLEVPHRYGLEKTYICYPNKHFEGKPGDIMVIYRTGEHYRFKKYCSAATGICILSEVAYPKSLSEMKKYVVKDLCLMITILDISTVLKIEKWLLNYIFR